MKETVYSAQRKMNTVLSVKQMFLDFREAQFLGRQLFIRDVKGMFRQSFFGILWAFIPPFFSAAIWIFLNETGAVQISAPGIPYPIFVFCGTILFQTFSEALSMPYRTVQGGASMMSKLNFPREAFLITAFYKLWFDFGLKLVVLLLIALALQVSFSWYMLLFLPGVLAIMVLGMSLGTVLIPFQMLFHDFSRAIALGSQALMYLTPVVYPTPDGGFLRILANVNPLTPFIQVPRNWFNGLPSGDINTYLIWIGLSVLLGFFGWMLFRITMPIIVERIGA